MLKPLKPALLLDVDGPLNPYAGRKDKLTAAGYTCHHLTVDHQTYPVWLNPGHGQALLALTDVVELVWATTWEHGANKLIAPLLGLPSDLLVLEWPNGHHACRRAHGYARGCWKTRHVADHLQSRPFAWFDDEINRYDRALLHDRPAVSSFLLRRVDAHHGLTDADFAAVRAWAEALTD